MEKVEYAKRILAISIRNTDSILNSVKFNQELRNKKFFYIFLELIYFYLHLTFRYALGQLENERIDTIMTDLEELCIPAAVDTMCEGWPDDMKVKIKAECKENYHARMQEYSAYQKLFAEKDEGTKNTLFWEFSKMIAELTGEGHNPGVIIGHQMVVVVSVKELDIKSFIQKVK